MWELFDLASGLGIVGTPLFLLAVPGAVLTAALLLPLVLLALPVALIVLPVLAVRRVRVAQIGRER